MVSALTICSVAAINVYIFAQVDLAIDVRLCKVAEQVQPSVDSHHSRAQPWWKPAGSQGFKWESTRAKKHVWVWTRFMRHLTHPNKFSARWPPELPPWHPGNKWMSVEWLWTSSDKWWNCSPWGPSGKRQPGRPEMTWNRIVRDKLAKMNLSWGWGSTSCQG